MKYFLFLIVALVFNMGATALEDRGSESDFQSINAIVGQLSPLDVIENVDGVRRSIDLNI